MKFKLAVSTVFSLLFAGLIFTQTNLVNATVTSTQPISSPISTAQLLEKNWTGNISIATWVKLNSYSSLYPRVISKLGSFELIMYTVNGSEGRLEWDVRTPSENDTITYKPNKLVLGVWNHVAATYDGNTSKVYINGVKVAEKTIPGSIVKSNWSTTLGSQSNGTRMLDASFKNPVATSSALTESDIQNIYQTSTSSALIQ